MCFAIQVVKPKISYFIKGKPVYSLPADQHNEYAFWWGVNCKTLGLSERDANNCRSGFPALSDEASIEFWLGFSSEG